MERKTTKPHLEIVCVQVGMPPAFPYTLNVAWSDGTSTIIKIGKKKAQQLIDFGMPFEG